MRYPEAQWLGNGQSGGSYTGGPFRLVVHTTETPGLPSYNDGLSAPHVTYDPEFRNFYQHTDFDTAARALRNEAGGVQTNRRSALQIEIICYSAKTIADQTISRQWVGDLSDDNLADLRAFVAWCGTAYGVKMVWPGKQALSYSQANAAGFRMSAAQWNDFDGVCGHQHVPENTHWDPGAINWSKLLPEGADMPLNAEDLAKIEALLDKKVGPVGIITDANGNPRPFHQYTVNGVWHAVAGGKRMMDHVIAPAPVDEAAVAAEVVAAMSPGLRAAVAAELKNVTLKSV